jgi:SLIT-ROBO Rho GTPase activating protein
MLSTNRLSRLQAKWERIRKSLGQQGDSKPAASPDKRSDSNAAAAAQFVRRKRIGYLNQKNVRLFGGSIEEYLEANNAQIPLVLKSCIRVVNLFGEIKFIAISELLRN